MGSLQDQELKGLVSTVTIPSQGRSKEAKKPAPVLAPKPDDDFRHLKQQALGVGGGASAAATNGIRRPQAPLLELPPASPLGGFRAKPLSPMTAVGSLGNVSLGGEGNLIRPTELASPGLSMSRYGMHRIAPTGSKGYESQCD